MIFMLRLVSLHPSGEPGCGLAFVHILTLVLHSVRFGLGVNMQLVWSEYPAGVIQLSSSSNLSLQYKIIPNSNNHRHP